MAESFNLFNRTNSRVQISDDGFYNSAGQFVAYSTKVAARFIRVSSWSIPNS